MYLEGSEQYKYHLEHYGHPSNFGYKDLCPQWTLLNWQPDELIDRYKKAGARFFFALANHHDGFDCWDSKHQPWNAAKIGPHRDVVGTWAKAARDRGLHFGVTVHQARNWWWLRVHEHGRLQRVSSRSSYSNLASIETAHYARFWTLGVGTMRLHGSRSERACSTVCIAPVAG
jgi:alpha-L-fucosidase